MPKHIALTRGQVALVSDEDFESLNKHKWYAQWDNRARAFYASRSAQWNDGARAQIRMHRYIAGASPGEVVDHINRDTLDNRRCNLRICSHKENSANQGMYLTNSSGFKGVSFERDRAKWVARVKNGGIAITIGRYDTPKGAALAYDAKVLEIKGEFAVTNRKLGLV